MNHSLNIFLVNKDVRAIMTDYGDPSNQPVKNQVMFKTLDQSIKKDDLVVIPTHTRQGMTVVKVIEVDVPFDFNITTKVDWIVSKVDSEPYNKTLKEEEEVIKTVSSLEQRRKREQMFRELSLGTDDALKSLALVNMSVQNSA